jgi:Flp pilus assembly protein TadG
MSGPARLYRRFIASTRAIAAIEFAVVMPVVALMFLGTFDAGRAIAIYTKIRSATFAIDAITNQYTTVQTIGPAIDCRGGSRDSRDFYLNSSPALPGGRVSSC